jgi:pantoate--beta-alanine ligase
VYLQPEERRQALVLSSTLRQAEQHINEASGVLQVEQIKQMIRSQINQMPIADIDYVEIVSYPELEPVEQLREPLEIVIALAVRFGKTRLIDNRIIRLSK